MSVTTPTARMPAAALARIDDDLAATDAFLASTYPGEDGRRQPVHTVYVPADRYTVEMPRQWGQTALDLLAGHGGTAAVARSVGLDADLAAEVAPRVEAKLAHEPVEDLRLDFEDGYGARDDETEDADAVRAAHEVAAALEHGQAPVFIGLRFKCLEEATRRRGLRTLDLFLSTLLDRGGLPENLIITLPKVSTVSQVEAMVAACDAYEAAVGLPTGRLRFEIQVETPQLIVGSDGRLPLAAAVAAGGGRVTALHYGTYDYSASLGIAAEYQSLAHPAADFAKEVMQVVVAGTGVHLADGSTNVVPFGSPQQVAAAWRLHHDLVRRCLERAYYQGWDMHPGHLPTRYVANFAFYRAGFDRAASRLAAYVHQTASGVLDEPATARALARYLHRGSACGAIDDAELRAVGLDADQLARLAQPRSETR